VELLKEYFAEIALLIYILYPLLKRLWNRGKKKRGEAGKPVEKPAATPAATQKRPPPRPGRKPSGEPQLAPAAAKRPAQADFLASAQTHLDRLKKEASRLLTLAEGDRRLARLVPALREDLLGRLELIERSLQSQPTLSIIVQETTVLRGLEALLRHLKTMAQQRRYGGSSFLADADKMADACYAPILELARAQGLDLKTSQPVPVIGEWDLSIVPRFASTRVAPLRLPVGFEHSLWSWPAIAHEVAHDFYYSLDRLDPDLHARLGLPQEIELPMSSGEVDGAWVRRLFGAWLPEIFADVMGTVTLGPAYVETMRRAFRSSGSPQQTAAILQDGSLIDEHPPARLRLYMASRVLHHLGRHDEADALFEQWERDHPDVRLYYLPLGGQWVGLADDALHSIADSIIDALVQRAWPELEGFHLLSIPGLAYLHAEHAEVERITNELALGKTVDADVRWIMAAAVLAAAAQPALHDQILEAARRSIAGVGFEKATAVMKRARRRAGTIGEELVASLGQPDAIEEAIILGAALTPYKRPRWH
jgi:tetratricopeptide (TPR) repeat protein